MSTPLANAAKYTIANAAKYTIANATKYTIANAATATASKVPLFFPVTTVETFAAARAMFLPAAEAAAYVPYKSIAAHAMSTSAEVHYNPIAAPFFRAYTSAAETAYKPITATRAMYRSAEAAYLPYKSITEQSLRYGTIGLAMHTYGTAKYTKYQNEGSPVWELGEDEFNLAGGVTGFALGFSRVSTAVTGLGSVVGLGPTAASAFAAVSVTASTEAALGKDTKNIFLSSSGKALEKKFATVPVKVMATAVKVVTKENPITSAPGIIAKVGSNYSGTISDATEETLSKISSMKAKFKSLRDADKHPEEDISPTKMKPS